MMLSWIYCEMVLESKTQIDAMLNPIKRESAHPIFSEVQINLLIHIGFQTSTMYNYNKYSLLSMESIGTSDNN